MPFEDAETKTRLDVPNLQIAVATRPENSQPSIKGPSEAEYAVPIALELAQAPTRCHLKNTNGILGEPAGEYDALVWAPCESLYTGSISSKLAQTAPRLSIPKPYVWAIAASENALSIWTEGVGVDHLALISEVDGMFCRLLAYKLCFLC